MAQQEAAAFNPRTVAALVAAGIVAFGAFLLLMAYGTGGGGQGRAHALSRSGNGFSGVVKLVEGVGGRAELVRSEAGLGTEDLVVATIEPRVSREALAAFLEERGPRATLLVLPKYAVHPHEKRNGWVRTGGHLPPGLYADALVPAASPDIRLRRLSDRRGRGQGIAGDLAPPLPAAAQVMRSERLKPLLTTAAGDLLLAQAGDRPLYILAEPDLLNNRGLAKAETARSALALLDALSSTGGEGVHFDLTLNGLGSRPSLLKLAFEPPFLPLIVAIFVAALLAGLHGAARFGPAAQDERAIALGKAALVENSAALFRIAKREHAAGPAYAEAVREAAARESAAHANEQALDAYLDRISPAAGPKFTELAARAAAARTSSELVAAARALFDWKRGLIK